MQIATSRTNPLQAPQVMSTALLGPAPGISPLMLSDRLITLAEDADRAGHADAATMLIRLAHSVLDNSPLQ